MTYENILLAVIYLLVGGLVIYAIRYIRKETEKIDSAEIKDTVDYVLDIISRVVGSFNQAVVDEAKKDGTFTKESAKRVKNDAIERINDILSDTSKDILNKGVSNIDAFISDAIQDEVRRQKKK